MQLRCFHLGLALLFTAAATATIGCTAPVGSHGEQEVGTIRLPLVTSSGGDYRLRNARFSVVSTSGVPAGTLDSDADPDAETLTATLFQGAYTVRLRSGWELGRIEADGTESHVSAALISSNPQSFEISASETTAVSFTFTTGHGTVTLGDGSLEVGVDVETNEGMAQCNPLSSSCSSGRTCLIADSTGRAFCASPGPLPVGAACTSDQCVAGAQCLTVDQDDPDVGTCVQFCRLDQPTYGINCLSLGLETSNRNVGFVGPAPEGRCDLLAQTGCSAGEACQYSGGSFSFCGAPGTTPAGGVCSGETCEAGYQCYSGRCTRICDTSNPYPYAPDCRYCRSVGTGNAGRCSN
jgi:hypothetical protein